MNMFLIETYNIKLTEEQMHHYRYAWETDHFNGKCRGISFADFVHRAKEQERFNSAYNLPQGVVRVDD